MRHLGQVGDNGITLDVLTHSGQHRVMRLLCHFGAQNVTQVHDFAVLVRNFDADGRFSGDWRQNTHVRAGHRVGDVVAQVGDLLHLGAWPQFHLVLRNSWAAHEADDIGVNVELLESRAQGLNDTLVFLSFDGMRLA